jgi:hypothetical protein
MQFSLGPLVFRPILTMKIDDCHILVLNSLRSGMLILAQMKIQLLKTNYILF